MNNKSTYDILMRFKRKFPNCVTWWRLRKHCEIIDRHLNPNEVVRFACAGQLDNNCWSIFNTGVIAITSERLVIAQNRLLVGYKFSSVTPDLYNDLQVDSGLIWGTLTIDTIKEKIYLSDLDKKSLPEIETEVSMFMQEAKKKYAKRKEEDR